MANLDTLKGVKRVVKAWAKGWEGSVKGHVSNYLVPNLCSS